MLRIHAPADLGITLTDLRAQADVSRRALAAFIAESTGIPGSTAYSQLQRYEAGKVGRPDLYALIPILEALGYELAVVRREDA